MEHSKYLSLTGSRFGLNAFTSDNNDVDSRAGARSKSPFEWWATVTIKDRSQSRNSQMTQYSMTNDAPSMYGMPSSPRQHRFYQRKELNHSSTSLESTSKDDSVAATVAKSAPSSPPPAIVRNFSRSFSRPTLHSKFSPRQHTLSRIEESSPHTSMISTRQSGVTSLISSKQDTRSSTSSPGTASPAFPHPPRWSAKDTSKASSIYHEAQEQTTKSLSPPPPVASEVPRFSFGEPEPRSSHASSRASHRETSQESRPHTNPITALPEQAETKQTNSYWGTRTDLQPIRSSSKKGNVLRKKSLKKADTSTNADS